MAWRQTTSKPTAPKPKFDTKDDDWETDTAYENTVTEKTQRYGSKSIPGSGRVDHFDLNTIHDKIKTADSTVTTVYRDTNPTRGYGGKYGTEQVMDKTAADFTYQADIKKHSSQTDAKKGFGGEHGIDERAKDKSAVGFDYKPTIEKHSSQTDASKGFGGKYGTEQNTQDKSAVGSSHKEILPKNSSQTDNTAGVSGKQSVQKEVSATPFTPAAAISPATPPPIPKVIEKPAASTSSKADVGNIRAKFENMKKEKEAEAAERVVEQRKKRAVIDEQLQQQLPSNTNNNTGKTNPQAMLSTKTEPASIPRAKTPPPPPPTPEISTLHVGDNEIVSTKSNENDETSLENPQSTSTEEPEKFVGGINVASLLRQRKTSSSSSKNEDDDEDQWAADTN